MAGLPNPKHLPTGNEEKLEVRCSTESKDAIKRMFSDIDPDMTYEEALQHIYSVYYRNPTRFE